jgi:RNA polymerase sigma-70 factor, ECF subfamily
VQDAQVEDEHAGELAPFAAAFDRTHERLWRALLAYSGNAEIARDAAAEAYAQAIRRGTAIKDIDAWVWRAAFRIAGGELARRRGQDHLRPDHDDLTIAVEAPDSALDLIAALAQVTERQRKALVLRYVGGYTAPEIASRLGTTAGSVRISLLRGRRTLRALLEEDHG